MRAHRLVGTVVGFDEVVGLGDIEAGEAGPGGGGEGTRRFPFHCTQIADGSRTVAVGTRVSFGVLAGRAGRWEAADIRPTTE
jgi:cold shock CspA family protein